MLNDFETIIAKKCIYEVRKKHFQFSFIVNNANPIRSTLFGKHSKSLIIYLLKD